MSIFTISKDLLQNIEHKTHYCDILFVFPQTNSFKVAMDKSNKILEIYYDLAKDNISLKTWLDLLSYEPTSIEKIDVELSDDLSQDEVFLKVCGATANQKKLLIYSHQNWKKYKYSENNTVTYDSCTIFMIDRDEAIQALKLADTNIVAINSVVATNQGNINNSKNLNNGKRN